MDYKLLLKKLISFTRGALIGILTGVIITLFSAVVTLGGKINTRYPYLILLIPFAAVLTQWIYQHFGNTYKEGTVIAIDEINNNVIDKDHENLATSQIPKVINPVLIIINFITTFFTHVFGASGGKEGAGVQIGLSTSTLFYKAECLLYKPKANFSYYLMCGAASAFASLFNAPIAGVFFGTQFAAPNTSRLDAYLSCISASFCSVFVSRALNIHTLSFNTVTALPISIGNFFLVIAFASIIGLLSIAITSFMNFTKSKFNKLSKNPYLKVLYPSLLLMVLNLVLLLTFKSSLYQGLGSQLFKNVMLNNGDYYSFFIKLILIILTYTACFTGGEVVPLLLLGSLFGSAFALLFGLPQATFATLGAVALLSGGTNLPLVCFALGFELFKYQEPTLLFVTVAVAFVFSGLNGIYEHQKYPY